jgi:hypothetical protein
MINCAARRCHHAQWLGAGRALMQSIGASAAAREALPRRGSLGRLGGRWAWYIVHGTIVPSHTWIRCVSHERGSGLGWNGRNTGALHQLRPALARPGRAAYTTPTGTVDAVEPGRGTKSSQCRQNTAALGRVPPEPHAWAAADGEAKLVAATRTARRSQPGRNAQLQRAVSAESGFRHQGGSRRCARSLLPMISGADDH